MKPERRMEELWEGGRRERSRMVGSEMNETGTRAAAARSEAEGGNSREGEAEVEPAVWGSGAAELCSVDARLGVNHGGSVGGPASVVRKVILR